jgi:hypothetical protein
VISTAALIRYSQAANRRRIQRIVLRAVWEPGESRVQGRLVLDRIGLAEPGYVQAPSGLAYAFVFIGRSGEPFPSGVEVYAVIDALEPVDEGVLDNDLWAILGWMISGVGEPWTVGDLQETGRLYRIPATSRR